MSLPDCLLGGLIARAIPASVGSTQDERMAKMAKLQVEVNVFATIYPELAAQWHPDKKR